MNAGIVLIMIAFSLSLDSFSVAISCGIKMGRHAWNRFLILSSLFSLFHILMPIGGWYLGQFLKEYVSGHGHNITGLVFLILGLKTIKDLYSQKDQDAVMCKLCHPFCLFTLAFATSIDAFMIGLTLYLESYDPIPSIFIIAVITFMMTLFGCFVGTRSLLYFQKKAKFLAAFLLLGLSLKAFLS